MMVSPIGFDDKVMKEERKIGEKKVLITWKDLMLQKQREREQNEVKDKKESNVEKFVVSQEFLQYYLTISKNFVKSPGLINDFLFKKYKRNKNLSKTAKVSFQCDKDPTSHKEKNEQCKSDIETENDSDDELNDTVKQSDIFVQTDCVECTDFNPLPSKMAINYIEAPSKRDKQNEYEIPNFDAFTDNSSEDQSDNQKYEDFLSELLEPPIEFRDNVNDAADPVEISNEEHLDQLKLEAGDYIPFEQKCERDFKTLFETEIETDDFLPSSSRSSDDFERDLFQCHDSNSSTITENKLEVINSKNESSVVKYNSDVTTLSSEGQEVTNQLINLFSNLNTADFGHHTREVKSLTIIMKNNGDIETKAEFNLENTNELFKSRTEFDLSVEGCQTDTILEPRSIDDLDSLPGVVDKWNDALSIEHLNKGVLKSSYSDVGVESMKDKKLVITLPLAFDTKSSTSAPSLYSTSSNESVTSKLRKNANIENILTANVDVIKEMMQNIHEVHSQQEHDEKEINIEGRKDVACDNIAMTSHFEQHSNVLAVNSYDNKDEILQNRSRLPNFDTNVNNIIFKLPPINPSGVKIELIRGSKNIKKSEICLPPLTVEGKRIASVNQLMVVGQNFNR